MLVHVKAFKPDFPANTSSLASAEKSRSNEKKFSYPAAIEQEGDGFLCLKRVRRDACAGSREGKSGGDKRNVKRLQAKRGRETKPRPIPMQVKKQWALKELGVGSWTVAGNTMRYTNVGRCEEVDWSPVE